MKSFKIGEASQKTKSDTSPTKQTSFNREISHWQAIIRQSTDSLQPYLSAFYSTHNKRQELKPLQNQFYHSYAFLLSTEQQIQHFVQTHLNTTQPQVPSFSLDQTNRVKVLLESIRDKIKQPLSRIQQGILSKNHLEELYPIKLQIITIFQLISKSNQVHNKRTKLLTLKKLLTRVLNKIQKLQDTLIKPLVLAGKTQQFLSEYIREINFFLIVAWIISFLLANKDQSTCLNTQILGKMTFRDWLWVNGCLTLFLTFIFPLWSCTNLDQNEYQDQQSDDEDEFTQLSSKAKQNNTKTNNNQKIKNQTSLTPSLSNLPMPKRSWYDYIVFSLLFIGILGKFIWIFFGIFIFLRFVNFDACGDNVLNYCSLEFLAFFSFCVYGLLSKILIFINKKMKRKRSNGSKKAVQERDLRFSVEGHTDDLQDILKRIVIWTLIGWVYDFILFTKDHSECLDEDYDNFQLTYRYWLLIDGITTLIAFVFSILLIIILIVRRENFMVWQLKEGLFQIDIIWVRNNLILAVILGFLLVLKVAWLFTGVTILCLNVNLQSCSGNIPNFLVAYFTESFYILIEGGVNVIKGYRFRKLIQYESVNQNESSTRLIIQEKVKERSIRDNYRQS